MGNGATSIAFSAVSHAIGDENDWGSYQTTGKTVTVSADRHGSSAAAQWFRDLNDLEQIGCYTDATKPDKLNFALHIEFMQVGFAATTYTCPNVYLGQGHQSNANNWWLGCDNGKRGGSAYSWTLACPCSGHTVHFKVGSDAYHFEVTGTSALDLPTNMVSV